MQAAQRRDMNWPEAVDQPLDMGHPTSGSPAASASTCALVDGREGWGAWVPAPRRVLDVGCGTGYVLRQLAARLPRASAFLGVDAAPKMIDVARSASSDQRLNFVQGTAERLPADDSAYDLVISTTSFDHWTDQAAGIRECARALAPGGTLVLCSHHPEPDRGQVASRAAVRDPLPQR